MPRSLEFYNNIKLVQIYIQVVEDRSSKAESETARRRNLADDAEARRKVLPEIRERSRQTYLKDRTDKQLQMLELGVLDEETFFKDEKLSKRERRDFELKKETLRLTKERLSLSSKGDEYSMPEGISLFHIEPNKGI